MNLIEELDKSGLYLFHQKAEGYKQALKLGVDLLVEKGYAEKRYYKSILKSMKKHGPYFVLAKGFAMPHARPEEGAKETGFALVTLDTPVCFGSENDPVHVLIFLTAKTAQSMTREAIVAVMDFMDDPGIVEKLRTCSSIEELRS